MSVIAFTRGRWFVFAAARSCLKLLQGATMQAPASLNSLCWVKVTCGNAQAGALPCRLNLRVLEQTSVDPDHTISVVGRRYVHIPQPKWLPFGGNVDAGMYDAIDFRELCAKILEDKRSACDLIVIVETLSRYKC